MTDIEEFLMKNRGRELVLDIETDRADRLLSIGFGWGPTLADTAYFHRPALTRTLEGFQFITHYGLSDALTLLREGVAIRICYDTYAAARCIFYTRHDGFALIDLEQQYFANPRETAGDMIKRYGSMDAAPEKEVEAHCRADCVATWKLRETFRSMHPEMARIITVESHLMHVLAHMRFHGFGFDATAMAEVAAQLDEDLEQLLCEIGKHIAVHPGSNDALAKALFDPFPIGLGIHSADLPRTPKTKRVTINVDLFDQIADRHPVLALIATWKRLEKMRSTYTTTYSKAAEADGRIHCSLDSFGSNTYRVIASGPNMQNIPARGRGYILRKAYVPAPGCTLLDLDLSQIEFNILAVMSGDKGLQEIIRSGQDFHRITAEEILYERPVNGEERDSAKPVNYGKSYGAGAWVFRQFGNAEAKNAKWDARFPGVKAHQDTYWTPEMQLRGYNLSYFKRRRQLYKLPASADYWDRARLYRLLINGDTQMTGADILKFGMDACFDTLTVANNIAILQGWAWAGHMVMCVHDDIVFEIRDEYLDYLVPRLIKAFVGIDWPLPLSLKATVGKNWFDMERWSR